MVKSTKRYSIHINKNEALDIKKELGEWRTYAKNNLQYLLARSLNDMIERLLFDACGDGRLVEIFYPIFRVAPKSIKPIILDYLFEVGLQENQEALASFEYEVFRAFLSVVEANPKIGWIATKDIKDEHNALKDVREQIKTRTVSTIIKQFGFKPFRTMNARGFNVNLKLIEKLKKRYQIKTAKTKKAKQGKLSP